MRSNMKGQDFLSIKDFKKEEIETFVQQAFDLKAKLARNETHHYLPDKTLGMIFANPSTRTRVSFETGMTQLGGHAQFYTTEDMQIAHKETWEDTGQVLSRYIDGALIRIYDLPRLGQGREIVQTLAKSTTIPIINALDDMEHPCQTLADILTIKEKFGEEYKKRKVVMSWAYSDRCKPAGVPHGIVSAAALLGMNLTLAYPEGYDLHEEYMNFFTQEAEKSGATLNISHNLNDAASEATVIYAKNWSSFEMTTDEDLKPRENFKDWCINKKHYDLALPEAVYMHCLPASRNQEVTDGVINGPHSIVYDQAENRLHAHKAILVSVMR